MDEKIRAHLIIKGGVQRVCYRFETKKQAILENVFGWVKNKGDGTVEGVFEGKKQDVEELIKWCEKGPELADVINIDIKLQPFRNEFSSFNIIKM